MPVLMLEIDEALRRRLEEVAALTGSETGDALVSRLLPRWIDGHRHLCRKADDPALASREAGWTYFDELDAEVEANYDCIVADQDRVRSSAPKAA